MIIEILIYAIPFAIILHILMQATKKLSPSKRTLIVAVVSFIYGYVFSNIKEML